GGFVVDGGGQNAVLHRHQADDQLGRSGRGNQMPHHALGARHGNLIGVIPQRLFDRQGLHLVVYRGAGAVGVDVVDVGGIEPRVLEGHVDAGGGSPPLGVGVGNAEGVGRGAVARDLAIDVRAPLAS